MSMLNTSLFEAAKVGNCQQISHWLDMGADINFRHPDFKNETPLFSALESGSEKAVSLLIRRGANVDVRNSEGLSPIHATFKGLSRDMVLELIKAGAKVSSECLAIVEEQSASDQKDEVIGLLQFCLRLTSFQAQYFLPMVYAVSCEKNLRRVKEELLVSFVNFEELKVKNLIKIGYGLDSNCHRYMPNVLKLVARRYGLNSEQLTLICEDLKSDSLKEQAEFSLHLAQVLRFSVERGSIISNRLIVEVLQAVDNDQLGFELLSTIEILVRKSQVDAFKHDHDEIKALAIKLKHPLAEVLEAFGKGNDIKEVQSSERRTKFTLGSAGKIQTLSVSKQLHTDRTSQKNKQSQEEKVDITSLLDSMANKNKRKQKDRANQKTPSVQKRSGDSTNCYRTTYSQVIKFHEMLQEGKLTDDDINDYLQGKFLDDSNKWFTGSDQANFLIDRLLCEMFKKASEKHCLKAVTINKLARCLGSDSSIKVNLFGTSDVDKVADKAVCGISSNISSYRSTAPGSMGVIAEQLYGDLEKRVEKGWVSWLDTVSYFYTPSKVIAVVDREIIKMRREAITAILNAAKFDRKILTKAIIKKVEGCLSSSDREVARKAIQILGLLGDSSDVDYKALFAAHLRELQSTSNQSDAAVAIEYITRQLQNASRFKELFTTEVVNKLIACTSGRNLSAENRLGCLEIIFDYLRQSSIKELSQVQIDSLVEVIAKSDDSSIVMLGIQLLILQASKSKKITSSNITKLLSAYSKWGESDNQNLFVLFLSSLEGRLAFDFNIVSEKLDEHKAIVQEIDTVKFVEPSKANALCKKVSRLMANMIVESLSNKQHGVITKSTTQRLVEGLDEKNDSQVRILCAKALYLASQQELINGHVDLQTLFELQVSTMDPVPDIVVYTTCLYVKTLHQMATKNAMLPVMHLGFLAKAYAHDELKLGDVDYSEQVNAQIMEIIGIESRKNRQLNDEVFELFVALFASAEGQRDGLFVKWLNIFEKHIVDNKYLVSDEVLLTLENYLHDSDSHDKVLKLLLGAIRNRQPVTEVVYRHLKNILLESDNQTLRQSVFECLSLAMIDAELPADVINVLEMEQASDCLMRGMLSLEKAWGIISQAMEKEEKLAVSVFYAITQPDVFCPTTLEVLSQIAMRGQPIPQAVLSQLVIYFDSKSSDVQWFNLFFHLVCNSQDLPQFVWNQLEKLVAEPKFKHKVLPIFLLKGQAGEALPISVIEIVAEIFKKALSVQEDKDYVTLQGCADSLCSFLKEEKTSTEIQLAAQPLFLKCLDTHQPYLIRSALKGFEIINTQDALSPKTQQALVAFLQGSQDRALTLQVSQLLNPEELSAAQRATRVLLQLETESDDDYLSVCEEQGQYTDLLPNNVSRLSKVLDSRVDLHLRVIRILLVCGDLKNLPDSFVRQIQVLVQSTADPTLEAAAREVLKKIGCENLYPLETEMSVDPEEDKGTLIAALFEGGMLIEAKLADFKQAMPTLSVIQLERVITVLTKQLSETEASVTVVQSVLDCTIFAAQNGCDSTLCDYLFSQYLDDERAVLRGLSFEGFSIMKRDGYESATFEAFCQSLQSQVKKLTGIDVTDLNILQVIASVDHLHLSPNLSKEEWVKGILVSDLAERWQLNVQDKLLLFRQWSSLEQIMDDTDSILQALHRNRELSFSQFTQIVKYLPLLDMAIYKADLENVNLPLYQTLRPAWLKEILRNKFPADSVKVSFLEALANKLADLFDLSVAEGLLEMIQPTDSILALNSFVDFIFKQSISVAHLGEHKTLASFRRATEINVLEQTFAADCEHTLAATLGRILDKGWSFGKLYALIKLALVDDKGFQKEKHLLDILKLLGDYEFPEVHYPGIKEIIEKEPESNWIKCLNLKVVAQNFSIAAMKKTAEQLLNELQKDNVDNKFVGELIESGLATDVDYVNSEHAMVDKFSYLSSGEAFEFDCKDKISNWDGAQILKWANAVKGCSKYFNDPAHLTQALAVIKQANFLQTGYHLTNTQIIACLSALKSKKDLGRLLQVQTGEGKTIIISVIAIIKALQGKKVDVITSSPVEAERCAREQQPLYKIFGISISDNLDRSPYIKGPKKCYHSDVVYGEMSQFQFDMLRDEYGLLGTKAGRQCEEMVGDEVDSICIDDSTKIAKLSTQVSGIDQLQPIFFYLYKRVQEMFDKIIEVNGHLVFLKGTLEYNDGRIRLVFDDEKLEPIQDLKEYIDGNEDISTIGQLINDDGVDIFFETHLKIYLQKLKADGVVNIPKNFEKYVERQMEKWIKNAMVARSEFHEKSHYLVHEQKIMPVAFNSNGTVQKSTQWGDGLHQLLQLKHGLAMTSESFTTNFLSNMAYVKRYKSNVCGLTGTLGPQVARDNLSRIYGVDCIEVPSAREKQYQSLPTLLVENKDEWLAAVCSETMHEARKGRGVLIICKTIDEVESLETFIKQQDKSAKIKTYTRDGCDQEKSIERILPGEIIIATSLAGRGFDIKADAVNKAGGMHVILTSSPDDRNCKQALFRTSRQGKLGSGRQILNKNALRAAGYTNKDFADLEAAKNKYETAQYEHLFGSELTKVGIKDELFKQFCKLVSNIRNKIRSASSGLVQDAMDSVKSAFSDVAPSVYESTIVAALEEPWAMLLKDFEDGILGEEKVRDEYKALDERLRKEFDEGPLTLIKNPCHHIVIGNDFLANPPHTIVGTFYGRALLHFKKAIELDAKSSPGAYIGIAWVHLKQQKSIDKKHYKQLAVEAFEKAIALLSDEHSLLFTMQRLACEEDPAQSSLLSKQLRTKESIVGQHIKALEANISSIKRSMRLVDVIQEKTYQSTDASKESTYHLTKLAEKVVTSELERSDAKVPFSFEGESKYTIRLNDLTVQQDTDLTFGLSDRTSLDQAIKSIDSAFSGDHKLGKGDEKIHITIRRVDLATMQSFVSPNIELKLSKLDAVEKLKHKTSLRGRMTAGWWDSSKVTVSVYRGEHETHPPSELTCSEAQALLADVPEDSQVHLCFTNANDLVKSMAVSFHEFDPSDALIKLKTLDYKKLTLTLTGQQAALLNLIDSNPVSKVRFTQREGCKITETTYTRTEAIRHLKAIDQEMASIQIEFESQDRKLCEQVLNSAKEKDKDKDKDKDIKVDMHVSGIGVAKSLAGLKEGPADITFENLTQVHSKQLVKQLREKNKSFSVQFNDLTGEQASSLIKKADLSQEEMKIQGVKSLNDLFIGRDKPAAEMMALAGRGLEYLLTIDEKSFIPWRSIASVAVIGTIQVALGSALVVTGVGATVGMGLITEGIADYATAVRAGFTRQFAWGDYCKQKAVSLIISATTMGWKAIKDGGKGIKNIFKSSQASSVATSMAEEGAEQAVTAGLRTGGKTVEKTVALTTHQLRGLAAKFTVTTAAETAAREGLNYLADELSHFCFENHRHEIAAYIRQKVDVKFKDTQLKRLIAKWHAIDNIREKEVFAKRLDHTLNKTLNPENGFWQAQWNSIGSPLSKGILSTPKKHGSKISWAFRIAGMLKGAYEIGTVIDTFHRKLFDTLRVIDNDSLSWPSLFEQDCGLSPEQAIALTAKLKEKGVVRDAFNIELERLVGVDLSDYPEAGNKIKTFLGRMSESTKVADTSEISGSIVEMMTSHIIQTAESQLVAQVSSTVAASFVNKVSAYAQDKLIRRKLRSELAKLEKREKNLAEQGSLPEADRHNHMREVQADIQERQGLLTAKNDLSYRSMIMSVADKKMRAWCQREMVAVASNKSTGQGKLSEKAKAKVKAYADQVRGDKPAEALDMVKMAAENGINLIVVDEGYLMTPQDIAKNIKVVVFVAGEAEVAANGETISGVGHWELLNPNGSFEKIKDAGANNCGYAVMGHLTGKSVDTLRAETADAIMRDGADFLQALNERDWLKVSFAQSANDCLMLGGKKKGKEKADNLFYRLQKDAIYAKMCQPQVEISAFLPS